ncbi:uncharacterized protein [Procambarus clarkii]|uniref:uncharacterized protein n=1 Tax=Procambarus clarkii TaxID=6728 RepID=UPI00374238EB
MNALYPLHPTDTETSQTTVCQDPFRQSSSQSTSCVTKISSDTPTALAPPPPTTTPSSITYTRPFKITRSVRSLFEEAAMDYASVLRTALLFPTTPDPAATSANITTTTVTTTQSCDTTLRTASHINKESRWNLSNVQSSNGTTWPVTSNVQPSLAAPSTPLPPTWVAPRPWEQGDSIVRSIQEIRCQFDPVPAAATLRQPRPTTVTRTPPEVRVTKCVVAPWKENSPVSGKTRQVRPLFRGARGREHSRKTGLMQMEEDECIDVEEVSPPRTTYHLYRLSADGTKCALPLTVVSREPFPKHPSAPDGSLQHHPITVSTPTQPHSAVTVSRHQLQAHPSGGQRQPSTHSNTVQRQNTESLRVCQPGTVHRQAVPALSPHQTRYDSNYSSLSVLKPPDAREGQPGSNMNKVAQGQLRAASTQRATDGDVQLLSNTEGDELLQCIIISSDSSPEVTENENEARTSAKALPEKEKSCRDSYLKHISKDTVSGRITDDLTKAAPPRDEVSKEVGIVPVSDDVDLPDLNRSPLPAAPGKLRAGEPEITDDPLTPDRAAAQDIDLSGASTIIFEDDLDADVTENTKDINEGENNNSDETFCNNKITSVAGNTLAYREPMSNDELPKNYNNKNDVPNFKLLQTSSDEVQSPTTINVEEHEIVRLTDKRQDDKIHRRNVRKLQLVMSDFICICFIPSSVKPSKNSDTTDTYTQSNDNVRKQQFTKSEHKADIRIREENNLEIFEEPVERQDGNIKLVKCMESVHVFEDNDVNHSGLRKDCVSTLKEVDILLEGDVYKDKAVDVAAPGIIPPEAINEIMELEKGITLREKSTDYCEFGDVSSSIFVSDGQLVFHIHVVSGSQPECVDGLSTVEVGTIRQYGYPSGDDGCQGTGQGQQVGCESSGTQNDNLEMSVKEQISDLRNGQISIDENKSVMIKDTITTTTTTDDVTPTERNEIVKERDRPTLSEINEKSDLVCDIIKEQIRTPSNRDKNSKEPENFKESEKSKENSDPVTGRDAVESKRVKIFTQECSGLDDNNVVNKTPLVYLENKSNCNSYIENALTVTNIDINGNKSPRTSETPSADNPKKPILSHKEITKSQPLQMNVLKHHEILDSQMPLKSTLLKEEMLKSQKDQLEILELPKLQNTQGFTMQSQDNPESLNPQNKLVDQAIPGSLRMVETKLIPTSRVVAEAPESLETQGGEGNKVPRDSQPVQINTSKSLKILYGTSTRGSVITRRDEQLDPASASTDIHTKHIFQQRYLCIMQGLVEELRLMGEREMKFIREEERRTVTGSDRNDKASSADIILDGGKKVEDSKAIPEQSVHEAEGSEKSTSKPRLSEADEEIGSKMNMIGNIDSNKKYSCRENQEIAINQERTKENEREKELKFIREINVAHTEAPVTLKSNEIGNTNKLSFPCKQHDEPAFEDSEVTEFPVRKILSDSERSKWHKQRGSEARDESGNQAEVVNIECKVDEPENNEVKIIEVQEEIIIGDDEDRTDGVDCYTRTTLFRSKLENSGTEGDDDSTELGQTEKRDNSARDVNDRRINSDYRSKNTDECFEAMKEKSRKSSRKVAPGPSVQDEQIIENRNSNRMEEAREKELSGLSKAHVTPNSPVCVAQSPKVVKRSSAITSPFSSVASISSISDFMKRISEKIDQLKVKTKAVRVDAGRHQQPVKRDFDSTLEDFISKHRQAEEGKQICYKATRSSGSRESERPNRCGNDATRYVDDVLKDEKDSNRCRISAVKCKEDTKCIDVKKYKRDAVGGTRHLQVYLHIPVDRFLPVVLNHQLAIYSCLLTCEHLPMVFINLLPGRNVRNPERYLHT